jgi:hypothetical protein
VGPVKDVGERGATVADRLTEKQQQQKK